MEATSTRSSKRRAACHREHRRCRARCRPRRAGLAGCAAADLPTAVSVLFECQGPSATTSAALDWLLATYLDADS